jgi:O-antigen/teichoic acid export membrane protein
MSRTAAEILEPQGISTEIGTAVRHSFIYGMGGIAIKVIGFLLLPFYTHYLSPSDYGVLEVLDVSMSLLGMFLNMGMTAAFLRFYGAAKTGGERRRVVGTVFGFTASTGVLILALGVAAVPAVSRVVLGPTIPSTYLLLSYIYFAIGYIGNIPAAYLRAKEWSGRVVVSDTFATFGILILSVLFLAVFKMAILGMLLSPLIVGGIKAAVLIKWMNRDMAIGIDWGLLRKVLRFGAPLVFSNLAMFTLNFSDRFFLQRLTSLEVVGIYAVGYKFGYLLNFLLIQPFNMMWQARMYLVHKRADHSQVFAQVFALYSFLLIFAALGLSLMSKEIIRFMVDPRYAAGAHIVGVVALAYVFLGVGYYVQLAMFLGHRTGLIGGVSAVAGIVNLVANYLLISRFGMMGAAVATLAAFLVLAVGSYCCSERVLPMRLPVGRVALGLGIATAGYLIDQRFSSGSAWGAVVLKCLILASFAGLLWFWLLSRAEKATVESVLRGAAGTATRAFGFGVAKT